MEHNYIDVNNHIKLQIILIQSLLIIIILDKL
jgi:hypothetical protein